MEKKNTLLLTIIAIATLLVTIIGAALAYFTATGGGESNQPVKVTTSSVDSTTITVNGEINIKADMNNFGKVGGRDQFGTTTATITYKAADDVGTPTGRTEAKLCYEIGIDLSGTEQLSNGETTTVNPFVYTTENNTPEFTITAKKTHDLNPQVTILDNEDITDITDNYKIPTTNGGTDYIHEIVIDQPNATSTDNWEVTLTLKWLRKHDQSANTGKNLNTALKVKSVTCPTNN